MNWKTTPGKTSPDQCSARDNLSFEGNGRVSVSVASIVSSDRVQQQVKAVRELQAAQVPVKK